MRSLDPTEVQCTFVGLKSPEILFGLAFFELSPRLSRGNFAELFEGGFEVFENNESIGLASKDLAYQLLLAGDSGYISAAYESLSRAYSRIDLLGLFSHRRSG